MPWAKVMHAGGTTEAVKIRRPRVSHTASPIRAKCAHDRAGCITQQHNSSIACPDSDHVTTMHSNRQSLGDFEISWKWGLSSSRVKNVRELCWWGVFLVAHACAGAVVHYSFCARSLLCFVCFRAC